MGVDYAAVLATAQRLLTENGRSVTLVNFDSTPADPNRPWLGPATDPRDTPDSTLTLDAVAVAPSGVVNLGLAFEADDLIKDAAEILICSPGANVDLTVFEEVIDETVRWKIIGIQVLRPATITVLAFIGVER